jgi:hypothetical protein
MDGWRLVGRLVRLEQQQWGGQRLLGKGQATGQGEWRTCSLMRSVERACGIGTAEGKPRESAQECVVRESVQEKQTPSISTAARRTADVKRRDPRVARADAFLSIDARAALLYAHNRTVIGKAHPSSRALWIYVPYLPGTLMGSRRECVRSR